MNTSVPVRDGVRSWRCAFGPDQVSAPGALLEEVLP